MKILLLAWKSFGNDDIKEAFSNLGHMVVELPYSAKEESVDENSVKAFERQVKDIGADSVFSFNYFRLVGIACKNLGIPYISWIYDSPYVRLYHYSVVYPTNHIFVFDQTVFAEFCKANINTVNYLPMAANTNRLSKMQDFQKFQKTEWANKHEVAFVGSLYTEQHQFYERLTNIKNYTRGYLEGLIAAQLQVYGYNFIQEVLEANPIIVEDIRESLPMIPSKDGVESQEYLYAQYVINRKITAIERKQILSEVAARFGLDLYTPDKSLKIEGSTNHGPVDYYDFAPYVFKEAKINLNISLRSIISGIPLRAFDIMGAGGFLITNFQADFLDFFVPDEDFVYYDSQKDLMNKIEYYLTHDEERLQIANNGYKKIEAKHTYKHRVEEMLNYL